MTTRKQEMLVHLKINTKIKGMGEAVVLRFKDNGGGGAGGIV